MNTEIQKNLRHNYIVNLFDGGFFGFAMGFASFSTMLPLFISTMTDSAILIGLIPAIHNMGWSLPQLSVAKRISRLSRYKPVTLLLTIQERLPFLGLAILAFLLPALGTRARLIIAFLLLIWQGLGAGFTANPWQVMIGRVIPGEYRATFFGLQSAAVNLLGSGGAIAAGFILDRFDEPANFGICFSLTAGLMVISWLFLSMTREPVRSEEDLPQAGLPFWGLVLDILKSDANFRWFIASRLLSQFGMMAGAFYTVYAVRVHGMNEVSAGILTSVLFVTQVAANPLLGRLADRWSRKQVLALGSLSMALSALLAWLAKDLGWFYPIFIFYGIGNTAYWTIGIALSLEFGTDDQRPMYVGLTNTLTAPATILAPFIGGFLADFVGYNITFAISAVMAVFTFIILLRSVQDPRSSKPTSTISSV